MSQSQLVNYGTVAVVDNLTRFVPLVGALLASATEANRETPVRSAGSFSKLWVWVNTNTATVNSTVTLRKSAADSALTLTIAADLTGLFEDTANSVAFAATDEGCYEITVPTETGTNTLTITVIGCSFTPDAAGDCVSFLRNVAQPITVNAASATRYYKLAGRLGTMATVETNEKIRQLNDATLSGFSVYVSSNARTTNTVFTLRINAADATQTVTFGAGVTGWLESGATDAVVSGDDLDGKVVTSTGTEILSLEHVGCMYTATNGLFPMTLASDGVPQAFNVTNFYGLGGDLDTPTTTEDNAEIRPRFTFTLKNLAGFSGSNTIATSATLVRARAAGADGNQSLSWAAAETGLKTDTVNTDVVTDGVTTVNYSVVTPNTSGSFSLQWVQVYGEVVAAGGGIVPGLMRQYRQRRM